MIYCIPTRGNSGREEKLFRHFGSAPFLALYDKDGETLEFHPNSVPGRGLAVGKTAVFDQIDAIICMEMGQYAAAEFAGRNITVFQTLPGTLAEIIDRIDYDRLVAVNPDRGTIPMEQLPGYRQYLIALTEPGHKNNNQGKT